MTISEANAVNVVLDVLFGRRPRDEVGEDAVALLAGKADKALMAGYDESRARAAWAAGEGTR